MNPTDEDESAEVDIRSLYLQKLVNMNLSCEIHLDFSTDALSLERTMLPQAILKNSVEQVKRIVEASTDPLELVNFTDIFGYSPMHAVARFNRLAIGELLVSYGAGCNPGASSRSSPLNIACRFRHDQMVELLLKHGADPMIQVKGEGTALHAIALSSTVRIADLVFGDMDKPPVHSVDDIGLTPLHNAAQSGNADMCAWLLERGAYLGARDARLATPFLVACRQGHLNVMQLLYLSHGSNVDDRMQMLHDSDDEGMSPLHHAVVENRCLAAEQLLKWGADPNTQNSHLRTALHFCALDGKAQMASLLLNHKADPSLKDRNGKAPLHQAVIHRKIDVIVTLAQRGADINANDANQQTPLYLACMRGYTDVVQILLALGASVTKGDFSGQTSLHAAVSDGHYEIMKLLLEHCHENDLYMEMVDMFDQSVMHEAARQKDPAFVQALIQRGFSATRRDVLGRLPLHCAARSSSYETVQKLTEVVPDINAECHDGKSPFFMACETGNRDAIKALVGKGANVKDTDVYFRNTLMAASIGGFTDIVVDLIKMGVHVNCKDKERNTALHHACENGRLPTVRALLDHNASVTDTNVHDMIPLDMAVAKSWQDVAVYMMGHRSWEESLSVKDKDGQCSLKRMIAHTPIAAKKVLDNCVKKSHHAPTDEGFAIEFNYTYIDPLHDGNTPMHHMSSLLLTMLDYEREELLSHPLTQSLLSYKWHSYGKIVFVFSAILQFIFLALMTAYYYVMFKPHDSGYMCNTPYELTGNGTNLTDASSSTSRPRFRYDHMHDLQYAIYAFIIVSILRESVRLVLHGKSLLLTAEFLLTVVSLCLITFANMPPGYEPCDHQWRAISVAMLLYFMLASLLLRRIDLIGLYFSMFYEVTKTMAKVSVLMAFFILSTSMPFAVMLKQDGFLPGEPAILSTLAMTLGELNFRDNFIVGDNSPFTIDLYIIFPVFCVIMNLCLMNLMIGVAVGDISKVEERAYLNRMRTQVEFLLEMERSTISRIRNNSRKLIVRPNTTPKTPWQRVKSFFTYSQQINFIEDDDDKKDKNEEAEKSLRDELNAQKVQLDKLVKMSEAILEVLGKTPETSKEVSPGREVTPPPLVKDTSITTSVSV